MARTDTPADPQSELAFEIERFGWTAADRLEVTGRWFGVRGQRFVRPTLHLRVDGRRRRLIALLDHKPWAPDAEAPWTAAFAWRGDQTGVTGARLEVSTDIVLDLPVPGGAAPTAPIHPRPRPKRDPRRPPTLRRDPAPASAEPPTPADAKPPAAAAEPAAPPPAAAKPPAVPEPAAPPPVAAETPAPPPAAAKPPAVAEPAAPPPVAAETPAAPPPDAAETPAHPPAAPPPDAAETPAHPPAAPPAAETPAHPPAAPPPVGAETPAAAKPAAPPPTAAEPPAPPPAAASDPAPSPPVDVPDAAGAPDSSTGDDADAEVPPPGPAPIAEIDPPAVPAHAASSVTADIATLALERRLVEERAERAALVRDLAAARQRIEELSSHHHSAVARAQEIVELEGQLAVANARADAAQAHVTKLERELARIRPVSVAPVDVEPLPPRSPRRRATQEWDARTKITAIVAVAVALLVVLIILISVV